MHPPFRGRGRATAVVAGALLVLLALAPSAMAAVPYRGFHLNSMWYDNTTVDRDVDLAASTGGNTVRIVVEWSSLETNGRGQISTWYRDRLDRLVNRASSKGLKVIAEVWATPCWASSAPDTVKQGCSGAWWSRGVPRYPPTNAEDFANIAKYIATRYGSQLAALELWNEPNLDEFLIAADAPTAYMRLVKAAYPAVKSVTPYVPVLVGATSFADWPFIDELYMRGLKGNNDGISVHAYNAGRAPGTILGAHVAQFTFFQGVRLVHDGQVARGDDKGLWVTEFGWTTCAPGGTSTWCVTQDQQASYLGDGFRMLEGETYVRSAIVYALRNTGTTVSNYQHQFGVYNQDFTSKSAVVSVGDLFHAYLAAGL